MEARRIRTWLGQFRWRGPWLPTGWLLVIMGGFGIVGWALAIRELVQPFITRAPVRPLASIGLLVLGISALALDRKRRWTAVVSACLAMAIGYLALLQLVTGLNLGTDFFSLAPGLALYQPPASPEILPLASAVGFLLGGSAMALIAARFREATTGAFVAGLAGGVLVTLNSALLLGQVAGLSQAVQFGRLTGSSPQVAVGLLGVGLCLASWAWQRDWTPASYPAWIPVAAGIASLAAVLFLWRALVQSQREDYVALLGAVARGTEDRIDEAIGRTNLSLWRVAWLTAREPVGSAAWTSELRGPLGSVPGLIRIAWVGEKQAVVLPVAPDSSLLRLQLQLQLRHALAPGAAAFDSVRHFSLADGSPSVAIAVPRCDLQHCDGFVVGLVRTDQMLRAVVGDSADGYHRLVTWRGQVLFGAPSASAEPRDGIYRSVLPVNDMQWELTVWPSQELRGRMLSGLPDLVLAFGLLVSALLPVTLQLGRTLKANARTAEQVRLRLALRRSMDRAWSWELTAREQAPALVSSGSGQEQRQGTWTALVHPDDRGRVEAVLKAHLDGLTPAFEAQYRLRDGAQGWRWRVDRGHVTERAADGTAVEMLGVSGDISERRRVDEEREKTERRFRAIFESAYHLQGVLDLEGHVLEANPSARALLAGGRSMDDLRGVRLWDAPWWRSREVRDRIRWAADQAREGRTITDEVEVESVPGDVHILQLSLKPILDGDGRVSQLLVEGRDITADRRAEAQVREVQALSSMGRLAARVAHEINNPLAGIQNSFLLLRDAIPAEHPYYPYVGALEREIGRIAAVTRQLYETYRPDSNGAGQTGVRTVIGDAAAFLEQVNRSSQVRVRVEFEGVPSYVAIPEAVLRQSIYNLVQNAVEVSPPGSTVNVKAALEDSNFVLRVADQGPGVRLEDRNRISKLFSGDPDAAQADPALGIGLFLVDRSVRALGGNVEVVDRPGGGTEFVVRFPLHTPLSRVGAT